MKQVSTHTHTHKRWLYSILTVIFLLPMNSFSQNNYYYYFDKKIYLDPVPNKYTVEFINTVDESVFTANNFTLNSNQSQITLPTNNYNTGLYFMSLVADGQVVDQKTFVVN